MENNSIAKTVFDFNNRVEAEGRLKTSSPAIPEGITGKFFTVYSHDKPYQNGIVFSDGSELSIGFDGAIGWSGEGQWLSESIDTPQLAK